MAKRSGEHILASEVVAYTTEESDELGIVLVTAHVYLTFFLIKLTSTQVVWTQSIIREILVGCVQTRILRILVRVTCHSLHIVFAETTAIVVEPLYYILALLAGRTTSLTFATTFDGNGAGRRTEPRGIMSILMVSEHHLCREMMIARCILCQQRQEVQLNGTIPVDQTNIILIGLQELTLHRIGTHNLTLEVIITNRIIWIHQRSSWVSLKSILEYAVISLVAVDDTRSDIGSNGEESTLGGMHDVGTSAILLTTRTKVDTLGITIIGTHTIVALVIATTEGQGMLHGSTRTADGIKPIYITAEVNARVTPSQTNITEILSVHHLQVFHHRVPSIRGRVRSVRSAVLASLLGRYQDDTIGTTSTIDSRGCTILQYVERSDVIRIDVGEVATWHTVNHNQRSIACGTRGDTTNLDACLIVWVAHRGIGDAHARHLTLDHHGNIRGTDGEEVFLAYVRNGRSKLFLVHSTITDNHHLIEHIRALLHGDIHLSAVLHRLNDCLKTYV